MTNLKDKIKILFKNLLKIISKTILFIIAIPFVIWLIFIAYDLVFNHDLRAKKSYQREITINFEYQGKDYVLNPVVTCINNGTTINEGSMEWYTRWSTNITKSSLIIDNDELRFRFLGLPKSLIEKTFNLKLKGDTSYLCDAIFYDDKNADNIDRLMQNYNKEEGFYYNYKYYGKMFTNIMYLKFESEIGKFDKKKIKRNSIKITSYKIGEKKLLNKKDLKELKKQWKAEASQQSKKSN